MFLFSSRSVEEFRIPNDVYSFSFLMYEIITNKKPSILVKEEEEEEDVFEFDEDIPLCYKNLILRCFSKNPKDRPTQK